MSIQQQFIGTVLVALVLTSAASAQTVTLQEDSATSSRRDQAAAPILHRRTSLPAGWFNKGEVAGALTDTQVAQARPVAHFDTLGPADDAISSGSTGAAHRLRRIRDAAVLDEVPQPSAPPAADAAVPPQNPVTGPIAGAGQATSEGPRTVGSPNDAATAQPVVTPSVPPSTTGLLPGVDQLPSVMKRPTPEASAATVPSVASRPNIESMKLMAIDPNAAPPVASTDVKVEPVASEPAGSGPATHSDLDVASDPPADVNGVLLENESPVLSVVTRGPKTIVVGKTATFVVDLSNRSDVAAKDVVVRMNIPQWVEIVQQTASNGGANIRPDDSGNAVLAWRVDHLRGRAGEKLTLELVPRGNRPLDLGLTWTFSPARSMTQIEVQEPKLQLSVLGPQDVLFGETKVYTITVSNPGTGDADNVVLNLLPLVPGEKTAGVRQLGTIAAGTRQSMEVELTARQTGRLEVRAEVTGEGGLMARAQQDVLVRRAVLEVQVEGPPMKYAGTPSRYAVRVANSGDAPATDVVVAANLPAGAKEVAGSDGGSFDANTGQIQWHVGVLRPGTSQVFEFGCSLMSPGDNRIDVRSVAAGDLRALGSAVTQVESLADLKLTVNDPQGAVAVGADVAYEVRIMNRGTKAAENIQVYGYFSEGIEPVGLNGWKGQLKEGEVSMQTIPRLGAGQEMLLRITARASQSGDHVFRAELECNEPETKLAVEEWTRFYGDQAPTRQADRRRTSPGSSAALQSNRGARD